jgi:hypothetical protein
MAIDLTGNIDRFESEDLRMFSYVNTLSIPSTVAFAVYNTDGALLAPVAVQSGQSVVASGAATSGMFYIFRQLPTSAGFYTYEWKAFGSGSIQNSLFVTERGVFEIAKTEAVSFSTYGSKGNVLRVARQLIGRGDLTERDVKPHMLAAQSYIDSRLGAVLDVPLSPASSYIAQGEEVLAVYTLYGSFGATEKGEIPPAFAQLREDFVKFLDDVIQGTATIDGAMARSDVITAFNGGIEGGTPTFGRRDWSEQSIDQDVLDDEDAQDD